MTCAALQTSSRGRGTLPPTNQKARAPKRLAPCNLQASTVLLHHALHDCQTEARALPDGRVEVEVPGDNRRWLTRWVLSFGGEAIVTRPDWAIRSVAEVASASLES